MQLGKVSHSNGIKYIPPVTGGSCMEEGEEDQGQEEGTGGAGHPPAACHACLRGHDAGSERHNAPPPL